MTNRVVNLVIILATGIATSAVAGEHSGEAPEMMTPGLVLPRMDAAEGRRLFASKGCVVCHSVNGVGGDDASPLDAEYMDFPMNPFEFAARMWRGAPAMVAAQEDELGAQIEFSGEELSNIIAFVHDAAEQAKFSEKDIPEEIESLMGHSEAKEPN